jgi:chromate reductase
LIGSLRRESLNRKLFESYRTLVGERATFEEGTFRELPAYEEELRQSALPEAVTRLADQIRASDGVLIVSPEYNYSVPGALKNAIDWLSRVKDQPFAGKPMALLSASMGRLGGARMQYQLRQIGVSLDARIMNKPEVMVGEAQKQFDADGHLTDEGTGKILGAHAEAFLKILSEARDVGSRPG